MKGLLLIICSTVMFWSCSKKGEPASDEKTMLLGKWEADYQVFQNDTIFYEAGSSRPCAYSILPLDYNSGFEFNLESKGELIWCGENKGQYFDWNYETPNLIFSFNDQISTLKVSNLTETTMNLYLAKNEITFHLVKTN